MTPEEQAKALADWLDQNPGSSAPEGVDPDVIEAVYVLRPDLAPAPRVTLESILERVEEGPFAASHSSQHSPARPRMWLWRGLGGLAAAAAVLLIALPQQEELDGIGPQLTPPSQQGSPFEDREPLVAFEAMDSGASSPDTKETFGARGTGSTSPTQAEAPPPARTVAEEQTATPRAAPAEEPQTPTPEVSDDALSPTSELLETDSTSGSSELGTRGMGFGGGGQVDSNRAGAEGSVASVSSATESIAESPEYAAPEPRSAPPASGQETQQRKSFPFLGRSRRSADSAPTAPAPTEALEAMEDVPQDAVDEDELFADLSTLRADAYPQDYQSPPATLAENPSPDEAQWVAAQKALDLLQLSKTSEALAESQEALSLSGSNTPHLSLLYWIQGEAYRATGRVDAARVAYEQAAELNARR